jgi:hypothetical protein
MATFLEDLARPNGNVVSASCGAWSKLYASGWAYNNSFSEWVGADNSRGDTRRSLINDAETTGSGDIEIVAQIKTAGVSTFTTTEILRSMIMNGEDES